MRARGLEPRTNGLKVRCSTRLSYALPTTCNQVVDRPNTLSESLVFEKGHPGWFRCFLSKTQCSAFFLRWNLGLPYRAAAHTSQADHRSGRYRSRSGPHFTFRVTWRTQVARPKTVPRIVRPEDQATRGFSIDYNACLIISVPHNHLAFLHHECRVPRSDSAPSHGPPKSPGTELDSCLEAEMKGLPSELP